MTGPGDKTRAGFPFRAPLPQATPEPPPPPVAPEPVAAVAPPPPAPAPAPAALVRASAIETIRIGEDEIHGLRGPDGQPWVVLRRACEVLGLDPSGQRQKLQALSWARAEIISSHDASGRVQEVLCLHADSVPMWLGTIDAGRCAPGARDRIVRFQREAARVLADWAYGRTRAPEPETEETLLARAVQVADRRMKLLQAKNDALSATAERQAMDIAAHRRHLDASQRAMVAAGLVPMFEAEARARQAATQIHDGKAPAPVRANLPGPEESGRARDKAAAAVNVSPRSVESALKVVREAPPEVVEAAAWRAPGRARRPVPLRTPYPPSPVAPWPSQARAGARP